MFYISFSYPTVFKLGHRREAQHELPELREVGGDVNKASTKLDGK